MIDDVCMHDLLSSLSLKCQVLLSKAINLRSTCMSNNASFAIFRHACNELTVSYI